MQTGILEPFPQILAPPLPRILAPHPQDPIPQDLGTNYTPPDPGISRCQYWGWERPR